MNLHQSAMWADGESRYLHVCSVCGWTIYDDNAADPQPCEAYLVDSEIPEHGDCDRVEVAPC